MQSTSRVFDYFTTPSFDRVCLPSGADWCAGGRGEWQPVKPVQCLLHFAFLCLSSARDPNCFFFASLYACFFLPEVFTNSSEMLCLIRLIHQLHQIHRYRWWFIRDSFWFLNIFDVFIVFWIDFEFISLQESKTLESQLSHDLATSQQQLTEVWPISTTWEGYEGYQGGSVLIRILNEGNLSIRCNIYSVWPGLFYQMEETHELLSVPDACTQISCHRHLLGNASDHFLHLCMSAPICPGYTEGWHGLTMAC